MERLNAPPVWRFAALLLCIPALLIHLGTFAFTGDEAIRALVALEMELSGNWIATTMHGADYINKPPLFNWFIWAVSRLWGDFGEWPSRLTTVGFLCAFAWLHYRVLCAEWGRSVGWTGAFLLLTSGRWLFYDSMLGLIDTAFSLSVYALWTSLWFLGKNGRWSVFFALSYLCSALGFLFKGFPAVVFQGLSLTAALIYFGCWRLLFSWRHVAGGLVFIAIVGGYFGLLSRYRDLDAFVANLFVESSKRTVVAHGWGRFWEHLFVFPFESVYHFLPWSLLVVFAFDRRLLAKLRAQPFAAFSALMLAVNLPIYWTSVHVEARYLLMFVPLFNTVGLALLIGDSGWRSTLFYAMLGVLLVAALVASAALPWIPQLAYLPGTGWIAAGLCVGLGGLVYQYFWVKKYRIWAFVAALLLVRIGFDLVIIPARRDESIVTRARTDIRRLADKYAQYTWKVYGDAYIREPASFYLTQRLGYIVQRDANLSQSGVIWLVNPDVYPHFPGVCVDTFQTDYPELRHLLFVRK